MGGILVNVDAALYLSGQGYPCMLGCKIVFYGDEPVPRAPIEALG